MGSFDKKAKLLLWVDSSIVPEAKEQPRSVQRPISKISSIFETEPLDSGKDVKPKYLVYYCLLLS